MQNNPASPTRLPPVEIRATETGYQLICKSLGVTCTATSVEAGYAALREAARHASDDVTPNDTREHDPVAIGPKTLAPSHYQSSQFSTIVSIIVLVAMVPLGLLTMSVLNDARIVFGNIRSITATVASSADNAPGLARATSDLLERAAMMAARLTPERQEQMSRDIAIISEKLAPLVASAQPIFEAARQVRPSDAASSSPAYSAP